MTNSDPTHQHEFAKSVDRLVASEWKRASTLALLLLSALGTLALGTALVLNGGSRAMSAYRAVASSDELLAECAQLEDRIDSLFQKSREISTFLPASLVGESHSVADLAGEVGLTLAEFSLAQPTGKVKSGTLDRWRLICSGSGRSWGQFLAALDHQASGYSIESATWSCKGITSIEVRGELILTPASREN